MKKLDLEKEIREVYNAFEILNEGKFTNFESLNDEQLEIVEVLKYAYFRKGFLAYLMIKE
ncbi:MAG: hypothetical protein KA080_03610 [Leptotrichiaceae bacterium]|nr:hypothetical protein [Leptotrichiaceae bacterium]